MKKGDVVTVNDGSYSRSIIDGKSIHEIEAGQPGEKFTVIETDCKFPVSKFNNTVIQAIDSGKVVFIEERFLRPVLPKHKVMVNVTTHQGCFMYGQIVEISDKLYQEIKRDSQS